MNIEKFYSEVGMLLRELENDNKKMESLRSQIESYVDRGQIGYIEDDLLLIKIESLGEFLDLFYRKIHDKKIYTSLGIKLLSQAEENILLLLLKIRKINPLQKIPYNYCKDLHIDLLTINEIIKDASIRISLIISTLDSLGVKEYEYKYDKCEISLIIPRKIVENNLKNFGQELISFEKNMSVFSEIATGSREPVRVKTIASSEFSIFLESAPAIGACIAVAVERIIALYKQSLEIKKIKLELEKNQVPDEISALLDKHVNSIVSAAAEKIAAELMEKHAARLEESRKNELLIELRHSIENLAEKLDKGFQIEVSVAELGEEKKKNGGQLTADEIARKQIAESAKKITYPISSGEPIPALPEKETKKEE